MTAALPGTGRDLAAFPRIPEILEPGGDTGRRWWHLRAPRRHHRGAPRRRSGGFTPAFRSSRRGPQGVPMEAPELPEPGGLFPDPPALPVPVLGFQTVTLPEEEEDDVSEGGRGTGGQDPHGDTGGVPGVMSRG